MRPDSGARALSQPGLLAGQGQVRTWKASRDDVDGLDVAVVDGGDVAVVRDAGEPVRHDLRGVLVLVVRVVLGVPGEFGVED